MIGLMFICNRVSVIEETNVNGYLHKRFCRDVKAECIEICGCFF